MKKLFLPLVVAALLLTACGGGSGAVVASVGGVDITVGEVEDLIAPAEGSTISKEEFAQFLSFEIQWEIVEQGTAADYGIVITEEEIMAEADRIIEETAVGQDREEFLADRGVSELFLQNVAHQGLLDLAVRAVLEGTVAQPTQEEIDAELAIAGISLTPACVSHILVETSDEAGDVMARLEAGEEFGPLATELSLDPGSAENNGILPCGSPGQYVPEFRDAVMVATVGEVHTPPVETEFGFHVIKVTDRVEPDPDTLPTAEEIAEGLYAEVVGQELNSWFLAATATADVTVDEEYGTWQAAPAPGVIPPAG